MIAKRTFAAAVVLGLGLTGCVTLLPKSPPAQLYRFGVGDQAPVAGSAAAPVLVLHGSNSFTAAAAGDRILTVKGDQTAYIAQARWVSPAVVLFEEAETRAFSGPGAPVRLVTRGQGASAPLILRLDVQTFEVRYGAHGGGAPVVTEVITAELTRLADRQLVGAKTIEVAKPAAENRVGAIVEAFNSATGEALSQVTAWTAAQGETGR